MRTLRRTAPAGIILVLLNAACGGGEKPAAIYETEQWLEVQIVEGPTDISREGSLKAGGAGKAEVIASAIIKITVDGIPQSILSADGKLPMTLTWARSAPLPAGPGVKIENLRVEIAGPLRVSEGEYLTDVEVEPEQSVVTVSPEYSAIGLLYDNGPGGDNVYVRARWLANSPAAG